jgi:fibronectin type 3 domain-containing protein
MFTRSKKPIRTKRSKIHSRPRRLRAELLEDRRMLAFSPWDDVDYSSEAMQADTASFGVLDFPGYRFAALASELELAQATSKAIAGVERIHLDFDGAVNRTFDGPTRITNIDVEPFRTDHFGLEGQETAIIDRIVENLQQRYSAAGIEFTASCPVDITRSDPEGASNLATVYIGPGATQFTGRQSLLGIAEHIDVGNVVLNDEAFVDSDLVFDAIRVADAQAYAEGLAAVIAHEIDHLRGWEHAFAEEFDEDAIHAIAASNLPTTPTLSVATAVSSTEVSLRWTNVAYEDGYRIWQSSGSAWQTVAKTPRDRTDTLIRGLRANTTYYFLIEAFNSTGSRYSAYKAVTTPTDVQRVTAPTLNALQALSSTQVRLTWSNVAHEDGYRIMRWSGTSFVEVGQVGRDVTTYTATGLQPNTWNHFLVRAYNSVNTADSPYQSVLTPTDVQPVTAPTLSTPQALSSTQVRLTWSNVNHEDGYRIMRWSGASFVEVGQVGRDVTTYTATGLQPNTWNHFLVRAYNSVNTADSPYQSVLTPADVQQVTAPTLNTPQALSSTQVRLTWSNVSHEDGYRIMRWSGSSSVEVGRVGRDVTTFTVEALQPNTRYYFHVQAFNSIGSRSSDWKDVTTPSNDVKLTNVPFVSQVLPDRHANNLCQFASAAMLIGQRHGHQYATQQMMQDLAVRAGKDKYGGTGATVPVTVAAVETYTGQGTTVTNGGWLTYDQMKQALAAGRAVSIGLHYETLGDYRASYYRQNRITVGNHQVVVIGFSEQNQTWTILDPLHSTRTETVVDSATFRRAVDAAFNGLGGGTWVSGWYFR